MYTSSNLREVYYINEIVMIFFFLNDVTQTSPETSWVVCIWDDARETANLRDFLLTFMYNLYRNREIQIISYIIYYNVPRSIFPHLCHTGLVDVG